MFWLVHKAANWPTYQEVVLARRHTIDPKVKVFHRYHMVDLLTGEVVQSNLDLREKIHVGGLRWIEREKALATIKREGRTDGKT